jgi:hypothetical protein
MIAFCRRILDQPWFQNGVSPLEDIETALRRGRPS